MSRPKASPRQGAILIVALVAVAIFTSLAATNIRWVLRNRQAVKSERDMVQVQLLCDAGCARAAQKMALDSGYTGEIWIDEIDPITGVQTKVTIEVIRRAEHAVASVLASLDARGYQPTRIQRTRSIALGP